MLKRSLQYIGILLTLLTLGIVHSSSPTYASSGSSHGVHSQHDTSSCQIVCLATLNKKDNKLHSEEEQDDKDGAPYPVQEVRLSSLGVGLLQENAIWKLSSWRPPDLTLLDGAYSTSL